MKNRIDWRAPILALGIIAVYILAGLVDPCDGHSCDEEVSDVR